MCEFRSFSLTASFGAFATGPVAVFERVNRGVRDPKNGCGKNGDNEYNGRQGSRGGATCTGLLRGYMTGSLVLR